MDANEAAEKALDATREALSKCPGTELESIAAFERVYSEELFGWQMRLGELEEEEE